MGKAVVCDKCGRFEKEAIALAFTEPGLRWELFMKHDFRLDKSFEWLLCPDCANKLMEFMKVEPEVIHG